MKPLGALGLVLVIVGGLIALALGGLRPVGGALAICGLALIVYSYVQPQRKLERSRRGPYSWEDDEKQKDGPPEIYTPVPGEVVPRTRPTAAPADFTVAAPGDIPPIRTQASGGAAEYTTGHGEVPPPREREHEAAEYSPPPGEMRDEPRKEPSPPPPGFSESLLPPEDADMPPMAPPPPAT
ncbi:MAG TPA: hypothetical protein VIN56_10210 [Candidatus Dormibacteraeota bacterium]|jgi:hypothetical protein